MGVITVMQFPAYSAQFHLITIKLGNIRDTVIVILMMVYIDFLVMRDAYKTKKVSCACIKFALSIKCKTKQKQTKQNKNK